MYGWPVAMTIYDTHLTIWSQMCAQLTLPAPCPGCAVDVAVSRLLLEACSLLPPLFYFTGSMRMYLNHSLNKH